MTTYPAQSTVMFAAEIVKQVEEFCAVLPVRAYAPFAVLSVWQLFIFVANPTDAKISDTQRNICRVFQIFINLPRTTF
jgi:hypothetical protein